MLQLLFNYNYIAIMEHLIRLREDNKMYLFMLYRNKYDSFDKVCGYMNINYS